jgi:hypothetical protein
MADAELAFGDEVLVPWGPEYDVRGTVQEVYGPPARRHVVVRLTPELSGPVVDEPTTVAMPIDAVKKVAPAV